MPLWNSWIPAYGKLMFRPMTERWLSVDCEGESMAGILHEPTIPRRDVGVLVVVGGPQYRVGSHRQFVLLARSLAAVGYPVLRFDYRGMGDSSGEQRTFDAVDKDIRAAIDALMAEHLPLRGVAIFGLCDAASAALMYCASDARVKALVLANPWVRTDTSEARTRLRHYYGKRLFERSFWNKIVGGNIKLKDAIGGLSSSMLRAARGVGRRSGSRRKSMFIDHMSDGLAAFHGPVLLLMSGRDLTAREFDSLCVNSPRWNEISRKPNIEWRPLPDADHTFSSDDSKDRSTTTIREWLASHTGGERDRGPIFRRPEGS